MKYEPLTPLRLVINCGGILLLHLVLLEMMVHTRVIEKVMALQCSVWELALILAFLLARFASYFLVPSFIVAFLVSRILQPRRKAEAP